MNQDWYSAAELAGLPGLPDSKSAVIRRANAQGWPYQDRTGRGGGREYPVAALPQETRAALEATPEKSDASRIGELEGRKILFQDTMAQQARATQQIESLKSYGLAEGWQGNYLDATLAVLNSFRAWHQSHGGAVQTARCQFAAAYNAGGLEINDGVKRLIRNVSAASLQRWETKLRAQGLNGIARRYGNRKGRNQIESQPDVKDLVVGMLITTPHCSATHIHAALRAKLGGAGVSLRTLTRYVSAWKNDNRQTFTAAANPDAWKSKYMPAFGSQSADIVRLNQRWELDSTPGDILLQDGRHQILGTIDVYSGRAKLLVSKTSKATAIATLMRHSMLEWGVPESIKTDNGADYTSRHLVRVTADLAIAHELCPPFQPWHKPHIERFFSTFSHGLLELLDGFTGHNVAERQAIRARKSFAERLFKKDDLTELPLTAHELQLFCDQWCDNIYLHTPYSGDNAVRAGKTPFEVVSGWRGEIRQVPDERALDLLLAEAPGGDGWRTVQKKGIELDGAWFIAPDLGVMVGERVHVRLDPVDLGRVYVFDEAGQFTCIAEAPERTGMDRREVAAKGQSLARQRVQEERRVLKAAAKRAGTDDIVETILRDRAETAGKLVSLPAPRIDHTSPGLAEAARAAHAHRAPALSAADSAALENLARLQDEWRPAPKREPAIDELHDDVARFEVWKRLKLRQAQGAALSERETAFVAGFAQSAYCRLALEAETEFELQLEQRGA